MSIIVNLHRLDLLSGKIIIIILVCWEDVDFFFFF
jgi:hypothetical protein